MAAFCSNFLDEDDDLQLQASEEASAPEPEPSSTLKEDSEVRTPEPGCRLKRKSTGGGSELSSEPKHPKASAAKATPKLPAVSLFGPEGAHNPPVKARGADKQKRAQRGTKNTFAGRRPPQDPEKLECYIAMKADYDKLKEDAGKAQLKVSLCQNKYWDHMKEHLAQKGPGSQQDKFKAAALAYRSKVGLR